MGIIRTLLKAVFKNILLGILLIAVSFVIVGAYPLACFWGVFQAIQEVNEPHSVEPLMQALILIGLFVGPFVNGFWMAVLSRWYPYQKAVRDGLREEYLQERTFGELIRRNMHATKYMLAGFFGTLLAQALYYLMFKLVLVPTLPPALSLPLFFVLLPFAVFAPIIILVYRRFRGRQEREAGDKAGSMREVTHNTLGD